jgi:hypothetical protein
MNVKRGTDVLFLVPLSAIYIIKNRALSEDDRGGVGGGSLRAHSFQLYNYTLRLSLISVLACSPHVLERRRKREREKARKRESDTI